jgi:hypothetical protein
VFSDSVCSSGYLHADEKGGKQRMERSKSLELHLTEAELETLINAVRSTSGRPAELDLGCAQLGEGGFLNLTTARSFLTLVEKSSRHKFVRRSKAVRCQLSH